MPTAAATSSSRVSAKPRSAKSASAAARIAARVRSERDPGRSGSPAPSAACEDLIHATFSTCAQVEKRKGNLLRVENRVLSALQIDPDGGVVGRGQAVLLLAELAVDLGGADARERRAASRAGGRCGGRAAVEGAAAVVPPGEGLRLRDERRGTTSAKPARGAAPMRARSSSVWKISPCRRSSS